ncbi:MAG: lysyl oxidase family protein [Candidatus Paceibacterota bacterium]
MQYTKYIGGSVAFIVLASTVVVFAAQHGSEVTFDRAVPGEELVSEKMNEQVTSATSARKGIAIGLLPDIRTFEPRDVQIIEKNDRTLLVFSTIYYNRGEGPLELVADPEADERDGGDVSRVVSQHIYQEDGSVQAEPVGTFVWHGAHNHYHFSNFVDFRLEPTEETRERSKVSSEGLSIKEKATFCVRDVSRVSVDAENAPADAIYRTCNEEVQGVSVGWGDTYFFDYPDQDIDVTDLPAGTYRLVFEANPDRRFYESDYENNTSWALIHMDPDAQTVEVSELYPLESPEVEHRYPEQDFENGDSDIDYADQWVPAKVHRNE